MRAVPLPRLRAGAADLPPLERPPPEDDRLLEAVADFAAEEAVLRGARLGFSSPSASSSRSDDLAAFFGSSSSSGSSSSAAGADPSAWVRCCRESARLTPAG